MQTVQERIEAYQKVCGLMNVASIEFGADISYQETDHGWIVINATEEALTFLISEAIEQEIHFRMIQGQLMIIL